MPRLSFALALVAAGVFAAARAFAATPARIEIAPNGKGFIFSDSNEPFIPWGFNYDRNDSSELLESYWHERWDEIVQDFHEMKQLGANIVRIHLQYARFMDAPDKPNAENFNQLERLVRLAQDTGLYLDLTGLACYRKQDVPPWYDALNEHDRWSAQARFWKEVARRCADSSAVFCYDLMNEPVAPGEKLPDKQWLVPKPLAGFYFVQYVTLDPAGRSRDDMFRQWTAVLSAGIRRHDKIHPITIGMLPFAPGEVARDLDFLSVHVYPEHGKVDDALKIVKAFNGYDKPIVIEEMFPMNCSADNLGDFITRSRGVGACGWIGFYWGKTIAELSASTQPSDHITASWLELFQRLRPQR